MAGDVSERARYVEVEQYESNHAGIVDRVEQRLRGAGAEAHEYHASNAFGLFEIVEEHFFDIRHRGVMGRECVAARFAVPEVSPERSKRSTVRHFSASVRARSTCMRFAPTR